MSTTVIRLILLLVSVSSIIGFWLYIHNRIEQAGFDRCEAAYEAAAKEQADKAETDIIEVEKRYEKIEHAIIRNRSPNDPVGPRVEFAIDSLPSPAGGR